MRVRRLCAQFLIGVYILSGVSYPNLARAALVPTTGSSLSIAVNCDSFCSQFGNGPPANLNADDTLGSLPSTSNPNPTSSSSPTPWSAVDDTVCADIGAATNGGVFIPKTPSPSPSATASSTATGVCSVPLQPGTTTYERIVKKYGGITSEACSELALAQQHCTFHNTQVETQCMAYNTLSDLPLKSDIALAVIDGAVAASCTAACAAEVLGGDAFPAFGTVCRWVGAAEGVTEEAFTAAVQSTGAAQYVQETFGALGIASSVAGLIAGSDKVTKAGTKEGEIAKKGAPCVSAAIFTALGITRLSNIKNFQNAKADACQNINNLFGTAPQLGPNNYLTNSPQGPNGYPAGGGNNGQGGGGANGSGGTGTVGQISTNFQNCYLGDQAACNALKSAVLGAATDSQLLTRTPNSPIAPGIQFPDVSSFLRKANQNGPAAALSSLYPASSGEVGAALAGFAKIEEKGAPQLASALGIQSPNYGGSAGGGAKRSEGILGTLGNLLNGTFSGSSTPPSTSTATFGSATPPVEDIWHPGTDKNLFQIVSDKIGKVTLRVK